MFHRPIAILCCCLCALFLPPSESRADDLKLGPQLNGAWYNPETSGQGFFLDINSSSNFLFAGWFTYKLDASTPEDTENHRWYTIEGELGDQSGGQDASFAIYLTSDGIFNDPKTTSAVVVGEAAFQVLDCNNLIVEFTLDNGEADSIPITRLLPVDDSECAELVVPNWSGTTLTQLLDGRNSAPVQFQPFLDTDSIEAGMYYLAPGAQDNQPVHGEDEVYLVMSGNGQLQVGQQFFPATPGQAIFVRAGVAHNFVNITEELEVLVLFSSAATSVNDPDVLAFDTNAIYASQPRNANNWNRFLDVASLHLGSYSLPLTFGGDSALTHEVDEFNIVTHGSATFHIGNETVQVEPGSLVWVGEDNAHFFDELSEDFRVLIMFHQKPGVSTP